MRKMLEVMEISVKKTNRVITLGITFTIIILSCADYEMIGDPDRTPDPVTLEIIVVTDSSVTLRWTQSKDEYFSRYVVYYGTDDIVDLNDKPVDTLSFSVDTVKTVRRLYDNKRYYFRVIVFNEMGNFSVSNIVDTVTKENMKGKLKLAAPVITDYDALILCWSKALEPFDYYAVYADTNPSVGTNDAIIAKVFDDTTKTITGLTPHNSWWFRVYAQRDTVVVATSNIVEVNLP